MRKVLLPVLFIFAVSSSIQAQTNEEPKKWWETLEEELEEITDEIATTDVVVEGDSLLVITLPWSDGKVH